MLSGQYSQYSPSLPTANQVRQPRAIVVINDQAVLWTDIQIVTTTFYVADSYRVSVPLYGQPSNFTMATLSTQSKLSVKIYVGFPLNPDAFSTTDLDLLMVGDCDEMTIDPLNATVNFSGRDLTSRFIDTKTYAKYANQTASSIVTSLANKHGLTPIVTPTQGDVGAFYIRQNTLMTKETTEWDLMTFLAQQYNFVVYVQQENLIFAPKPTTDNSVPYTLSYQQPATVYGSPVFNGMELNMMRCFTVAKDVTVKIRVPYNPLTGRAFTQTVGKKNPSINSTNAGNQVYTYTYPGLTNTQALAKAQQLLSEITLNELKISALVPGDNLLTKSSIIQLIGTNSQFDQAYYTDTVTRTLNVTEGYLMEIQAKNQDVKLTGGIVMSDSKLMNMIRLQASIVNNSKTLPDIGVITGYDPDNYAVTVQIYPQDLDTPALVTGWIPLFTPWSGDGWGLFLPPNIGDMVEVHYQAGSLQNAYAGLRTFSFQSRPLPVPSGEFWLVHKLGGFIKLTNDGNLAISSTTVINVTAPIVNIDSPEVNLGSGTLGALLSGAAAAAFDSHTHTGSFSGPTSPPSTSMASDVTSNVFGS